MDVCSVQKIFFNLEYFNKYFFDKCFIKIRYYRIQEMGSLRISLNDRIFCIKYYELEQKVFVWHSAILIRKDNLIFKDNKIIKIRFLIKIYINLMYLIKSFEEILKHFIKIR